MRPELLEPGAGRDVVILGPNQYTDAERYRRALRRWRRRRREAIEEQERLNAPGNVTLTEAQRKLLDADQRADFRLLNQQEQLRYQRELQHSIMEHRRAVEDAREERRKAARQLYLHTGAFAAPADPFVPPSGNPMDAIRPFPDTLPTHKRRRTAGLPPYRL